MHSEDTMYAGRQTQIAVCHLDDSGDLARPTQSNHPWAQLSGYPNFWFACFPFTTNILLFPFYNHF